ncbi:MAG: ABC transporter ATP-binding protein [Rickettsiales bacterium]|jgi:lipoprotein-releasing system ATP-binding protein|nr:ABC transporter ATP-binding protein [Rickettsiales bacterium]
MSNGILKSLSKVKKAEIVMSVQNIGKTFMTGTTALHILRGGGFDLARGEIVALVGPSGCGKSTLMQCVGLLEKPTRGTIIIGGVTANKNNDIAMTLLRRKKLGFVYQRHNLLSDFTAIENIAIPMMIAGMDEASALSRAGALLKRVSMSHRANHLPGQMSGGEQQRVAIARALANNPEVLLADEPTGSLDPANAAAVFDLLLDVARGTKMSMLFVTHDINLAKRADRTITIKDGIVG